MVGHFVVDRPRTVLGFVFGLLILCGLGVPSLFSSFDAGGYDSKLSESYKVNEIVVSNFFVEQASSFISVESSEGVGSAEHSKRVSDIVSWLGEEFKGVRVVDGLSQGGNLFVSKDNKASMILVFGDGSEGNALIKKFKGIGQDGFNVYVSGGGAIGSAINKEVQNDVKIAEIITIPLSFLLLLFVFGSFMSSITPIIVGLIAVIGSFGALSIIKEYQSISIFAVNIVTGLGLGLGIDYSLLVVNRFREEMEKGLDRREAAHQTLRTAGKTVFFSGLTVMVTLLSLLFFPANFLKSLGLAGSTVVGFAVFGAVIPLCALLSILGDKVNKGRVITIKYSLVESGFWYRLSEFVVKRAKYVFCFASGFLLLLLIPLNNVVFAQADHRILPRENDTFVSVNHFSDKYEDGRESLVVVLKSNVDEVLKKIRQTKGVERAEITGESNGYSKISVFSNVGINENGSNELIERVREVSTEGEGLVGGVLAEFYDSNKGVSGSLWKVILWIFFAVYAIIFLFTGSYIIPLKAVLLNFLSLLGMIGLLSLVFVHGEGMSLLGDFVYTGSLDSSSVVLCAVVAFGLSMDYELFLLSRIKEEYDASGDNIKAVSVGLQRSGKIITAAAGILGLVFGAFISSGVTSVKMLGFGIMIAIVIDATVIRGLLVPSLMKLMGRYNWVGPRWVKSFVIKH
ncbi:MAG: MMPL family transporter [Candidatus Paceibacterota bacterium]